MLELFNAILSMKNKCETCDSYLHIETSCFSQQQFVYIISLIKE